MDLSVAIKLIEKGIDNNSYQVWADLGAGNGLFTQALATILHDKSTLYAIDKDEQALAAFNKLSGTVTLHKIVGNFIDDPLPLPPLDGVLLANALHFVKHKINFAERLKKILKPAGRIILVEYDLETANQWVPYPISYLQLKSLSAAAGFTSVTRLAETPSRYSNHMLYAASINL
jgi:SAM-dependent methyltransferase